ncbi:RodZ domain-containing protein [Zestomonas thermotolerans]|uniref:RodZ domain-containing protein n=1 Tax=Zestomonas thermotolerans TaxID=157784 RepID=UPI0004756422|nr:RodZ family helix-turn-helix domain-containing protein [Pseudomonas thermotolerans]
MMKAVHTEDVATASGNPGESLRQAREARGWSLAQVAAQLNLTNQRLTQLEAGEFDKLPGHTFARGYVRAYAKLLGLDADTMVRQFDQFTGTDASGSEVHDLGRVDQPVRLSQNLLRMVSFALLVGLAGVGFVWWQSQSDGRGEQDQVALEHVEVESADGTVQIHPLDEPEDQAVANAREEGQVVPSEVSPAVAAQPEPESPPVAAQAAASQAAVAPASTTPAAPAGEAPAAPEPPAVPAPSVAATEQPAPAQTVQQPAQPPVAATSAPTPAAGEGVVSLGFTADCWIQITDASGKVLVSGLKRSGERVELTGKVPMEVRLGYARGAQLSYNGQAVDVTPHISGETARLKVGQ